MKLLRRWADKIMNDNQKIQRFEKRFTIEKIRTETQKNADKTITENRRMLWENIEKCVEKGEWNMRVYPWRLLGNAEYFVNKGFVISEEDKNGFNLISWKL